MKEDTVWSFERLQSYIDEKYAREKELPENWVYTTFTVSGFDWYCEWHCLLNGADFGCMQMRYVQLF